MKKLKVEKPKWSQQVYYCPYCSRTSLLYLWLDERLIGLGLDKWLYCSKCKRKFKKGIFGIHEQELDMEISTKYKEKKE